MRRLTVEEAEERYEKLQEWFGGRAEKFSRLSGNARPDSNHGVV